MDPLTISALISGGMSIAGGLGSGFMGMGSASAANAQAEDMYKHRYQWAMRDMKKAGLNPMLAYSQGGGGVPSTHAATFPNVMEGASTTAREFGERKAHAKVLAQEEGLRKEDRLLRGQQFNTEVWREQNERMQTALTEQLVDKAVADKLASIASARRLHADANLSEARLPGEKAMADFYSSYPFMRLLEQYSPSAGAFGQVLRAVSPGRVRHEMAPAPPREVIHRRR